MVPRPPVYMIVMNDLNEKDVSMATLLTDFPLAPTTCNDQPVASAGRIGIDLPRARRAVRELLLAIGENPNRAGLAETPDRVARAFADLCSGLHQDPAIALARRFTAGHGELVLVTDIDFTSLCEHHLLPFTGVAHVAYLPTADQVVGLSKLARAVEILARRPQIQEALTAQIADVISKELDAAGVLVVVEAAHQCLRHRGVRKAGSSTITTAHRGRLRDELALRQETHLLIASRRSDANPLSAGFSGSPSSD